MGGQTSHELVVGGNNKEPPAVNGEYMTSKLSSKQPHSEGQVLPMKPDQSNLLKPPSVSQNDYINKQCETEIQEHTKTSVHDPRAACSPITLEYAEELLLMAVNGKCVVLDVTQVRFVFDFIAMYETF